MGLLKNFQYLLCSKIPLNSQKNEIFERFCQHFGGDIRVVVIWILALVKQCSRWSSMLLEVMWGLDIQSLSILGGDLDQTLFTFCFESVTSVSELSREGGVNFGSL